MNIEKIDHRRPADDGPIPICICAQKCYLVKPLIRKVAQTQHVLREPTEEFEK
jgi:hypothetical protein